ncbi:DNA mismatch repair endonuclease MutL [Candidatus Sumerlaeota bacterium]|nr:DNA mismatch repair endonuclease MutL [Candidatus Sumerlaeota bacterium]
MIIRLPKILIDQIAAGEVVVRPASVVKELIENSIDAQARHITITVGNALRDIVVADDGIGMSAEDASLALERHATSKISSIEDLRQVNTRGFRGEALPSITAVSRLTLTTRRSEDMVATRITADGGRIASIEQAGAPAGTNIAARDLFYNTPARLKFLKGPATELGQIVRTIVRQGLASPSVALRFINQEKVFLDLPADQSLLLRAQQLLGRATGDLLEVKFEKYDTTILGYVAKPLEARRDRRHQFFFVNGRPISHRALACSAEQAYEGLIATDCHPVVVLFVTVRQDEVDVNVHPTKEEIRFRDENKVAGLIHRAVSEALGAANLLPQVRLPSPPSPAPTTDLGELGRTECAAARRDYEEEFRQASAALHLPGPAYESPAARPVGPGSGKQIVSLPHAPERRIEELTDVAVETSPQAAPADELTVGAEVDLSLSVSPPPRAIAQVADTYIVAQVGNDLLLIDQHAAHERLLYLRAQEQRGRTATQPLLVPISVEVRPSDRPMMEHLIPVLAEIGFETDIFGGHTFIVRSAPGQFEHIDVPALINDLLDDLERDGVPHEAARLRERVATRLACHAAVKAGQQLRIEEMQQLIDDLLAARLHFTCPHGRPTMILLTRDQLDRQFKRK